MDVVEYVCDMYHVACYTLAQVNNCSDVSVTLRSPSSVNGMCSYHCMVSLLHTYSKGNRCKLGTSEGVGLLSIGRYFVARRTFVCQGLCLAAKSANPIQS